MLLSMESITASKPRSKRGSLQSGTRLPPFLHSPSLPRPTQPLALTERLHVSCISMLCCVTPLPLSMLGLSGKRQKQISLVLEKGKASCTARHCHLPLVWGSLGSCAQKAACAFPMRSYCQPYLSIIISFVCLAFSPQNCENLNGSHFTLFPPKVLYTNCFCGLGHDSAENRVVHFVQGHLCPEASSYLCLKLTFPLTPLGRALQPFLAVSDWANACCSIV